MLLILQNIQYVNIFPLPMIICSRATNACLVQPIRSIDENKLHAFCKTNFKAFISVRTNSIKKLFLILYSLCYFVVTKMSLFFHFNYFYTPRMMNIMHLSQRPIVSRITIIILPTLRT